MRNGDEDELAEGGSGKEKRRGDSNDGGLSEFGRHVESTVES